MIPRKYKRESGLFFTNAMEQRPYCRSHMEVSYCTFGFGAICAHNRYHVIHRTITDMRAWFNSRGKGNSRLLGRLRYNNSAPYVTARWLPQQIPLLNFLEWNSKPCGTQSQSCVHPPAHPARGLARLSAPCIPSQGPSQTQPLQPSQGPSQTQPLHTQPGA